MAEYAQVHRHQNDVCAYLGDGQTVRLSPAEARKLSKALLECAQDVKKNPSFIDSQFKTFRMNEGE